MLIESFYKNKFQILKLSKQKDQNPDFSILEEFVKDLLRKDNIHIALSFSEDFHLYSEPVGILMSCHKMIKAKNGTLAIINPNESIANIIKITELNKFIVFFPSEDTLKISL